MTDIYSPSRRSRLAEWRARARRWRVGIGILVLLVSLTVYDGTKNDSPGSTAVQQSALVDRADGCSRYTTLSLGMAPNETTSTFMPKLRGLRDAAAGVDAELTSDLTTMLTTNNQDAVEAGALSILRRCRDEGFLTEVQIRELQRVATDWKAKR